MKSSKKTSSLSNSIWKNYGPVLVVLAVTIGFTLIVLANNQWDPMAFVHLGTQFTHNDPNGTIGYDGQFIYHIAVNPWEAAQYIDIPAYRYQRILYPLAARIFSFGQPTMVPWILIGLNLIALSAGTYALSLLLAQKKLSRWYALPAGIFAGQLVSLRFVVNEPFSLAFALWAVYAFETKRPRWGAVLLALSILSKETALLFVAGYLLYYLIKKEWRLFVEVGLISLTPFLLWQIALWFAFGQLGLRSGGEGATTFSLIPFGSLLAFGLNDPQTLVTVLIMLGPLILLPVVALAIVLVRFFRRHGSLPVAFILALHIIMMITLPFSTYVDLPGVLRLTSGLVVATLTFAAVTRSRKILNYSTLWLASVVYLRFLG